MKFKLILCFVVFAPLIFAQRAFEGEALFNNKQYSKAIDVYENLLKRKPNDALYNYRYARCSYELKDFENAILHFEKAKNKFSLSNLYLGELYFNTYRFDESVSAYQAYIASLKPDDPNMADYQKKERKSENAANLITKVEDIAILDSVVVNKKDFLKYYKFSSDLGSISQELLKLNARQTVDKIKYITQRKDRIYFSDSVHGQMDIFSSYKLLDGWSKPMPLSKKINTPANENYPFLLLDGVTIYFASDGENSIGGYDIFITRYNPSSDSYLNPENIGFPFNSPANDYMMVIDEQRKLGWFATDRNQSAGKVMIYTFIPNEEKVIIHSDDKSYIRLAAQLKTYRKATNRKIISSADNQNQQEELENNINFVINDSIVYSSVAQFKSDDARKLWIEMHKMSIDFKNKTKELSDLRDKYSSSENESERAALTPQIIELEKKNMEMKKNLALKSIQVRNEEIKLLQKK